MGTHKHAVDDVISVVIIEDHVMVSEALQLALGTHPGIEVVGAATTLQDGAALVRRLRPAVVVLDHTLPDGDATSGIAAIHGACDDASVIVLSAVSDYHTSYGGAIGLTLLARHPERVRRLALLDPALALSGSFASANALATIADAGFASVEEATIARNEGLGEAIDPAVVEDVAEHLVRGDDGRYRFRYHQPAVVTGWGEVCHPMPLALDSRPCLLVVADRAGLVHDGAISSLRALLGEQLTVTHLECGHMLYWERFEDTAAAVTSFLDQPIGR